MMYSMNFDGCSKGNPGKGGAGAVLYCNDTEIWSTCVYVGDNVTNNVAEYTGLLIGMIEALERGITTLTIRGDSELIIKQMNGKYKVNSPSLSTLYSTAKRIENSMKNVQYIHVYREYNKRADALSNDGLLCQNSGS
jgi:ribonuclease HI